MRTFQAKFEVVMQNEHLWERKGKSGSCRHCGQYIRNGESYYLIVINGSEFRDEFPKESNFIVHKDDFEQLSQELDGNELAAIRKILSAKHKRPTNRTPVNEEMVERFKRIAPEMRLRIMKETRNRIYFKPYYRGRIGDFVFDKRSLEIFYNGRGFNGLFDGMFLRELISRIEERLHGKETGFRVDDVINRAKKEVNEMMK